MEIRKARQTDIAVIMEIYRQAKLIMQASGNPNQWINGYPSIELIENDISDQYCNMYVNDGLPVGVFYYRFGDDPTYGDIENGQWLNDLPYGVVHRMAAFRSGMGIARNCLKWCFEQCQNIRVDTHLDNRIMQHILLTEGFSLCGTIYLANGTSRLAFQKYANK